MMGMDVYGKAPSSPFGEYFRNNVWYWHPLWSMVQQLYPWTVDAVEHGHSNSGDGLDAEQASRLASEMENDLSSGRIDSWLDQYEAHRRDLPWSDCTLCEGSGVRKDEVGVKLGMVEKQWCNGCDGKGLVQDFQVHYHATRENVEEFAVFVRDSGGFEIW